MKGSKFKTDKAELYIPLNGNITLKRQIINIATNKGMTYSQYLRGEIIKIVAATDEALKRPPMEY